MARRTVHAVVLAAATCLFPGVPRADPAANDAAPVAYPVDVQVRLSPAARAAVLVHRKSDGFLGPANPDADVPVGQQALAAYLVLGHRLFAPGPGQSAGATLLVERVDATLALDPLGWRAVVRHEVALHLAGGEELGRWTTTGEERIGGLGPGALRVALSRAATTAAARLESAFEQPPGVRTWLAERGAPPGTRRLAAPPPAFVPAARVLDQPGPPRSAWVRYLEAEAGVTSAAVGMFGAGARGGVATGWLFLQAGLHVERRRAPPSSYRPQSLELYQVFVDAGPVLRLGGAVELRSGPGLAWREASLGAASTSFFSPHFLAAVQYTSRGNDAGRRLRVGLEIRKTLGGSVSFERTATNGATDLQVADLFVGILVGYELPWSPRAR